jgi:GNAT superfamily N-acetyltransferase
VSYDRQSLRVTCHHERQVWERREPPVRCWDIKADVAPFHSETDEDRAVVGRGEALVVELHGRDPLDALDEHGETALHLGEAIFDPATGALAEDLAEKLRSAGDRVLVLNSIEVEERWRGLGLGPVIAGLVVEALGGGALAARWDRGVAKLSRLCETLGFRPHRDGVLFLDPSTAEFTRRFAAVMDGFMKGPEALVPAADLRAGAGLRLVTGPDRPV